MPKAKTEKCTISVRIPVMLNKIMQEMADQDSRTKSYVAVQLLEAGLSVRVPAPKAKRTARSYSGVRHMHADLSHQVDRPESES